MFEEAKATPLTERQKQIIFGSLLGDMGCYKRKNYVNWSLGISHGINQKDYFLWKFEELKPLFNRWRQYTRKSGTIEVGTDSICHPELKSFGEMFYKEKKKIVPTQFAELINLLSFSVWLMDDGTISEEESSGYKLLTCDFTYEENEMMSKMLKDKLDFTFKVITISGGNKKKYPSLKASMPESRRISEIIKPYIIDSMLYKTMERKHL